jgi:xanthosine utilization system XapX-like protein
VSAVNQSIKLKTNDEWNSASAAASRAIGDLFTAYGVIAIGAALAFVFAFVYLQVVQCAAAILVWVSLLCILLGGAFISAACLNKASDPTITDNDPNKIKAMKGVGIVFAVCTFLYFCAIVFMRDRIRSDFLSKPFVHALKPLEFSKYDQFMIIFEQTGHQDHPGG